MQSDAFDVIPYEDIMGEWIKLGSGSFGFVYKAKYLGIDVAIKEVRPSTEYDVSKYFEREWRLMKESRHPNIVLFLGLSRAPDPDGRIFIISEFIENGNLRQYIHDKAKPFPWRLRLSFATDITRALAYLHARKCIHRDLKGENLLVTSNGRLKITDFGFARIAARSAEESKRLTFCGTDSYMSPEILIGDEFDLPTDIFSLGVIFCEILARKLADDHHFKRTAPTFAIDGDEVRSLASEGCPPDLITLALECLSPEPSGRPGTRDILERLRVIEAEVLSRPSEQNEHIGSIRSMNRRPGAAPRIPSFGVGVGKDIKNSGSNTDESDDDELMEAVMGLSSARTGWSNSTDGEEPLLESTDSGFSDYSTTVIRAHPSRQVATSQAQSISSILTIHATPAAPEQVLPAADHSPSGSDDEGDDPLGTSSIFSIDTLDSYHTAHTASEISTAHATEGGSTIRSLHGNFANPLVHRFTLIKPGIKPKKNSISGMINLQSSDSGGWNPLDLFFSSGLLVAKCDVCTKRLGWKPVLECDDCGLKAHIKCGDVAPRDCGVRPNRPGVHQSNPIVASPFSKVKQAGKSKSSTQFPS
ncbi:kinase-like domain-containing protein [Mycena floridula]|nr:kinase-like domain-containing protein [Mycena floridula]